ncbi:hypothetical protein RUM43_003333 [Polyplax serrata]|uniref:Uncharacterized protein n=1 Tax=Polyplax serrata TaxID=468196 RepID=A0AAN8PH87_POLSC
MQQCGFCSALTEVFRRLMCIGGSRRGSGESCYQELDSEETVTMKSIRDTPRIQKLLERDAGSS